VTQKGIETARRREEIPKVKLMTIERRKKKEDDVKKKKKKS